MALLGAGISLLLLTSYPLTADAYAESSYYAQGYYQSSYSSLNSLITAVPYSPGSGGYAPTSNTYWGGGGGGGLIINGSTVNGADGALSPNNGGKGYGGGGGGARDSGSYGGAGAPGVVYVEWDLTAATCSVSFSSNPIVSGESITLNWTSSGADDYVYIENVGAVSSEGSASYGSFSVAPSSTTDYSCYANGSGGSDGWHDYELTVYQNCTAPWGDTVGHGSSTTAYEDESVPYGSSCVSETRSCTNGTLSGSYAYDSCEVSHQSCMLDGQTVAHGSSHTFYSSQAGSPCSSIAQARTCSDGTLSGSATYQYASCTCAPLYSCSGDDITYTDASCTTTTVLSCAAPYFCSPGTSSCVSPEPVFNESGGGTLSGHLQAAPLLIPFGSTSHIYWNVSNVESCSVTENSPFISDSWTGLSGSRVTSPLFSQTIYTLHCEPLEGASFSDESVTVNIVPIFQEL